MGIKHVIYFVICNFRALVGSALILTIFLLALIEFVRYVLAYIR